ncbi:hypothetical protein DXG03_005231 [Asterophora parasitica]|uniref:DUF6699 domain-containing protein n=1 Tax=Asterophora parasitica TaxID=117018 RepID=A0A9P7G0J1_9AGAR|nr:hypothetical protein DXG03_005231 [Asterophora parasitica]
MSICPDIDELPSYLPAGTSTFVPFFSLQRDPRYFYPLPNTFIPKRWLPATLQAELEPALFSDQENVILNTSAFIPFSVGASNCVGKNLAWMEMSMIVCLLVQAFEVRFAEGYDTRRWDEDIMDYFVIVNRQLPVVLTPRKRNSTGLTVSTFEHIINLSVDNRTTQSSGWPIEGNSGWPIEGSSGQWPVEGNHAIRAADRKASRLLRRKSSIHSPTGGKFPIIGSLLGSRRRPGPSRRAAEFDPLNLARRPQEWRMDYCPPSSRLSQRFSLKVRSGVEYKAPKGQSYQLSTLLSYKNAYLHPIASDLRLPPSFDIQFLDLERAANQLDFFQLATSPAVNEMWLYHPLLPWYIEVHALQANGITLWDIFTQIHQHLTKPVLGQEFYNEVLTATDRELVITAYSYRLGGQKEESLRRMDFLGFDVMFCGLAKGKNGLWEIKTAQAQP